MKKYAFLIALAALPVALLAGSGESEAQGAGCKATRWTLSLPQGDASAATEIVRAPENKVWRIGVGRVPANAMLVIEYKGTNGAGGELVLNSGAAQFVEGSTVTMRLLRGSAPSGSIAVAGTYQIRCGKN